MTASISRRDFFNGFALAVAAGVTPLGQLAAQQRARIYPPALTGLRGSTDASFGVIHALAREGRKFDVDAQPVTETFDLVVVGAGLAGLAAAFQYQRRRPSARILILDNHDDFGGHARRCEMMVGNRMLIGYGGSESMVSPKEKFTGELAGILRALKIEPARFESEEVFHRKLYPGLRLAKAVFFDKETFGRDLLVRGDPLVLGFDEFAPKNPGARPIGAFLAECPLPEAARAGLLELFEGRKDYLAGSTGEQKVERLGKVSYRGFLTEICKLPAVAADFFQQRSSDNWGVGIDGLSAMDALGDGYPGAKGLGIEDKAGGDPADRVAYVHHFPDGNASLARAMVRALIPGAAPGNTMGDLVTARFDYGRLDLAGAPVRLRLGATAVRVKNEGGEVDVGYVTDDRVVRARAKHCIVATYGSVMPHLCPQMAKPAAETMAGNVKLPMIYSKVAIRNWESFVRLGVHRISAPMGFHCVVKLDYPVSLGSYKFPRSPKEPMQLHLVHVPLEPNKGHDVRTQARIGRSRLMSTSFAEIEAATRQQLDRMLGLGGFESGRDIAGITVHRWSHGYSYTPSTLYDDVEGDKKKAEAAKAKIGNIAFANSDTAWDAYAHTAMAEGARAAGELMPAAMPATSPRRRFRRT